MIALIAHLTSRSSRVSAAVVLLKESPWRRLQQTVRAAAYGAPMSTSIAIASAKTKRGSPTSALNSLVSTKDLNGFPINNAGIEITGLNQVIALITQANLTSPESDAYLSRFRLCSPCPRLGSPSCRTTNPRLRLV